MCVRSLVSLLPAIALAACGSDVVEPEPEEPPAAPVIDWAALGPHRIVLGLYRLEGGSGLYRYDGVSETAETLGADPGRDIAVSPDGEWVAYRRYTDQTSFYDIYVARVDGSSERRLSDIVGNSENGLAWRRDGRLVYTYREGGDALTRRIAEADPTTGVVSPWDPGWPGVVFFWSTSSHIDFASDNSAYAVGSVREGAESVGALFHRSRGRTDTLLIAGDSDGDFGSPALSPDETLLAFEETLTVLSGSSRAHVYTRLRVLDMVGGGVATVLDTGSLTGSSSGRLDICWTADGTTLVYTLWTGAERELWAVGGGGGTPRQILGGFGINALTCLR